VIDPGVEQFAAVGQEGERVDVDLVPLGGRQLVLLAELPFAGPELDRAVQAAGGQGVAVRAPGDGEDFRAGRRGEDGQGFAARELPDAGGAVK
jgi:hypothetical protein